jgi:hypothetical protein
MHRAVRSRAIRQRKRVGDAEAIEVHQEQHRARPEALIGIFTKAVGRGEDRDYFRLREGLVLWKALRDLRAHLANLEIRGGFGNVDSNRRHRTARFHDH